MELPDSDVIVLEDSWGPNPQHLLDDEAFARRLSQQMNEPSSDEAFARRLAAMEDDEADVVSLDSTQVGNLAAEEDPDVALARALTESLEETKVSKPHAPNVEVRAASSSSHSLSNLQASGTIANFSASPCPPELEGDVNILWAQHLRGEEVETEPPTPSKNYKEHALHALFQEFRQAPLQLVQDTFEEFGSYSEARESLQNNSDKDKLKKKRPERKRPRCPKPKALDKEMQSGEIPVTVRTVFSQRKKDYESYKEQLRSLGQGALSTCGCCYEEVPPEAELRCNAAEGHSFCFRCVKRQGLEFFGSKLFTLKLHENGTSASASSANNEPASSSGPRDLSCTVLPCMEISGCKGSFSDAALRKALPDKEYVRYSRRSAALHAAASGLNDLVGCPACDYMIVMSNPTDGIIRCLNSDCGRVSCRWCLEKDHTPLRCDEVEKDAEVRIRTFLEERMAEYMMRRCPNPKCRKACEKDEGCNHVKCPCGTHICYLCGEKINGSRPYDHYKDGSEGGGKNNDSSRCTVYGVPSWAKQAEKEAYAKALKALEEYLQDHPELQEVWQQRKNVLKRTLAHVMGSDGKRRKN